jgi:dTDP-4-amino-4,6-dideoxygalactose transaminase
MTGNTPRAAQSALPAQDARIMQALAPWPVFAADERAAADAVLASGKVNYWTGNEARQFEEEYARYIGIKHAVAVANGTVALEIPLRMWGIGPGDEVVVTPRTFIASTSCVVLNGARPVFADVDRDSGNITPETIERVLTPRTRAIIPVHLAGWPCEMERIKALAAPRGIRVLEDCAQAHGARIDGRPVGSFGDASAFSFCQDKIITTGGEGGLIVTDDSELWDRCWSFKDHGKSYEAVYRRQHGVGFRWLHESFGTNARLTEFQAAIGRRQLSKLDGWVDLRRRNAAIYRERFAPLSALHVPIAPAHVQHSYYKFYVQVRTDVLAAGWSRDRLLSAIVERGAPCFAGSASEVYREAAFAGTGLRPATALPVARELGETSLMFLVHPTLSAAEVHSICDVVDSVVRSATR